MKISNLEDWVKGHWLFSGLLAFLFITGVIFQTTDTVDRLCQNFKIQFCTGALDYSLVSVHLDHTDHSYGALEEGVGMGNPVLKVRASDEKSAEIVDMITGSTPRDLFVFQIQGTGTQDEEGMILHIPPHDEIDQSNAPFVLQINVPAERFPESQFMIHFPSIDPDYGSNSFQSEPANCCVPWFEYRAFVRLVPFQEKMQFGTIKQYRAKFEEPTALIAQSAGERLESKADFNLYFGGETF